MVRSLPGLSPRLAVSLFFLSLGILFSCWVARIPAVSERLDLNTAQLGTLLLFAAVGSIVSFQFAGGLIQRHGSALIGTISGCGFAVSFALLAVAPDAISLGAVLFVFGFFHGMIDIAVNAQGVEVERVLHRKIMSSLHGFFSLGGLIGAALSGGIAFLGIGIVPHFLTFAIIAFVVYLWAGRAQLPDQPVEAHHAHATAGSAFRRLIPPRALWAFGVIAFCAAIGEGGMADWSSLFLHQELKTSEGVAALGYTTFSTTMLLGRFSGDRIVAQLGGVRTLRICGLVAAVGMALAVATEAVATAMIGFALVGIGLSVIIPVVYSAAGRTPGLHSGQAVASVATIGYTGFLAGPPVLGWLAQLTSLPFALTVIVVLSVVVVFFASAVDPARATSPSAPLP